MKRAMTAAVSCAAVVCVLSACSARSNGAARSAPLLTSVSPTQVNIGGGQAASLTVRGTGFDSLNTVHFGALRIPGVPRTNDSVMQFAVPTDDTYLPNRGPVPVRALNSGTYELRIETTRGTSNALSVTLTAGGVR